MARLRQIGMMGQAFPAIDHGTPVGQPTMIRMDGVPHMPGARDRFRRWPFWGAIILSLMSNEALRRFLERIQR